MGGHIFEFRYQKITGAWHGVARVDTNVVLELLLDQQKADDVDRFFHNTPRERILLSDFSLYSVGIILLRRQMFDVLLSFTADLLLEGGISLLRLAPLEMPNIVQAAQRFKLDFDDAYQYALAEKHDLEIISFDHDFDRTKRGRKTPDEALKG